MKRINTTVDRIEPDWLGLEKLVRGALHAFQNLTLPGADQLRAQADAAEIVDIDFTGHGFYAHLSVPPSTPALTGSLPMLLGAAKGGPEFIGINVWFDEERRLNCIEGFNLGEAPFTGGQAYAIDYSESGGAP